MLNSPKTLMKTSSTLSLTTDLSLSPSMLLASTTTNLVFSEDVMLTPTSILTTLLLSLVTVLMPLKVITGWLETHGALVMVKTVTSELLENLPLSARRTPPLLTVTVASVSPPPSPFAVNAVSFPTLLSPLVLKLLVEFKKSNNLYKKFKCFHLNQNNFI